MNRLGRCIKEQWVWFAQNACILVVVLEIHQTQFLLYIHYHLNDKYYIRKLEYMIYVSQMTATKERWISEETGLETIKEMKGRQPEPAN